MIRFPPQMKTRLLLFVGAPAAVLVAARPLPIQQAFGWQTTVGMPPAPDVARR
jgi:hypothetical protein